MKLAGYLAVVVAVSAPPAAAQGVFDMGVLTNTLSVPTGSSARHPAQRPVTRNFTPAETAIHSISGAIAGQPSRAGDIRLNYTETPALRRAALDAYLARLRRDAPDAAQAMAVQFARHDYAKVYSDMMKGSTLRDNDAADAVTAYTLLGWQVANDSRAGVPDRQVDAVRRQIAAQLAASPQVANPRVRASLGEEMKLLVVTVHAGWQGAAKEGNSQRYSDGIAAMFKRQSGWDLRAVRLTDAGFTPR